MAVTATPIYPQTFTSTIGTIAAGDTTTAKLCYTAGANGSKIESIIIANGDASTRTMTLSVKQSATNYTIGTFTLPASAGTSVSVAPYNAIGSSSTIGAVLNKDSNGNPYIYLAPGSSLYLASGATVTVTMNILTSGEDF